VFSRDESIFVFFIYFNPEDIWQMVKNLLLWRFVLKTPQSLLHPRDVQAHFSTFQAALEMYVTICKNSLYLFSNSFSSMKWPLIAPDWYFMVIYGNLR
jgi:hypothetical protein